MISDYKSLPIKRHGQKDERIAICEAYLNEHIQDRRISLAELADQVHLSPSRLSHLFKAEKGLSMQNYVVWLRLRHTIGALLEHKLSLLEAAYGAGFYDAAHFSKAFRKTFGLNPSAVYNSHTVQI